MELLKEPRNAVATANLVGLIGSTMYFYRQMEVMRGDMLKINETLTSIVRKIGEMEKKESNKGDVLKNLSDQLKQLDETMKQFPSSNVIDSIDKDLAEIVSSLGSNGIIDIELPSLSASEISSNRYRGAPAPAPISAARRRYEPEPEPVSRRRPEPRYYNGGDDYRSSSRRPEPIDKNNGQIDESLIDEVRKQFK